MAVVLSTSDGISVWNMNKIAPKKIFISSKQRIIAVAVSPDGFVSVDVKNADCRVLCCYFRRE